MNVESTKKSGQSLDLPTSKKALRELNILDFEVSLYVSKEKISAKVKHPTELKLIPCRVKQLTKTPQDLAVAVTELSEKKFRFFNFQNCRPELWLFWNDSEDEVVTLIHAADELAHKAHKQHGEEAIVSYQRCLAYLKEANTIQQERSQDVSEIEKRIEDFSRQLLKKESSRFLLTDEYNQVRKFFEKSSNPHDLLEYAKNFSGTIAYYLCAAAYEKMGQRQKTFDAYIDLMMSYPPQAMNKAKILCLKKAESLDREACLQKIDSKWLKALLYKTGEQYILSLLSSLADKSNKGSLLHFAVWSADHELLAYLCQRFADFTKKRIEAPDSNGRTPISIAAYIGDETCVDILYQQGADLEAADHQGNHPLHLAVNGNHSHMVEYLVKLKANPTAENQDGHTPLACATLSNSDECINSLQVKKSDFTPKAFFPENLVIQGGGPKGLAYISALEELEGLDILKKLKRTAGTSSGAITAALLSVGCTSEEMNGILNDIKLDSILDCPTEPAEEVKNSLLQLKEDWKKLSVWEATRHFLSIACNGGKSLIQGFGYSEGGFCEGKIFFDLIEFHLNEKSGIKWLTFGELRKLAEMENASFKHVHIVATKLGDRPEIAMFSSEDPACDDIVISSAVRASMSIPVVFKPGKICKKINGQLVEQAEAYMDGGVLYNYPLEVFDKKKYKHKRVSEEQENDAWTNPYTWGLSLHSRKNDGDEDGEEGHFTMFKILKQIYSMYSHAETNLRNKERSTPRTISIDNRGVKLLDFNLSPERRDDLLQSGKISVRGFLAECKLSSIGKSQLNYSDIDLKMKIRDGHIHLKPPHPLFVQRSKLTSLENLIPRHKKAHILLHGPGGVGKSELAISYAYTHLDEYSIIWSIDAETEQTQKQSYRQLAAALKLLVTLDMSPEQIKSIVHGELKKREPWLLIFDNLEVLPLTLPEGGTILITSRNEKIADGFTPLKIDNFLPEEAVTFLETAIGCKRSKTLTDIAERLDYSPLLLNYASHYLISNPQIAPSSYLETLSSDNELQKLLSQKDPTGRYPQSFAETYEATLLQVGRQEPLAVDWLGACAYLNSKDIPLTLLEEWLAVKKLDSTGLKRPVREAIIRLLKSYALIYDDSAECFSLHRMLQKALLIRAKELTLKEVVAALNHYDPIVSYNPTRNETIENFQEILSHCEAVLADDQLLMNSPRDSVQLVLTLVRYFIDTEANFPQSLMYLQKAEKLNSLLSEPFRARIAFYYGMLALRKAGREKDLDKKKEFYQNALASFKKACDLYQKDGNPDNYVNLEQNQNKCTQGYQIAISKSYQAQALMNLGFLDEAHILYEGAKEDFSKLTLPKYDRYDVPRILRDQADMEKDKDKAIEIFKKVIEMQKKVYGSRFDTQPTVAASYDKLGKAYMYLQKYPDACKAYEKALSINKKIYKLDIHPYVMKVNEKYEHAFQAKSQVI